MSRIVFYTQAYNAEKTLGRTIESILRQTKSDFLYYIFDDGSTDKTKDIIKKYAALDDRVIPQLNKLNHKLTDDKTQPFIRYLVSFLHSDSSEGYWAMCDADDEYKPDFLERVLAFTEENKLDLAACSFDTLDSGTGQWLGKYGINQNLLLSGTAFSDRFPQYFWYTRTMCGKLFSLSLLRKCTFSNVNELKYGSDTLFTTEAFSHAERAGIFADAMYKYYLSPASISNTFDDTRISADRVLNDTARKFLIDKCSGVSYQNDNFLLFLYFNALLETLTVLLDAQIGVVEKIKWLHDIFSDNHTKRLIAWPDCIDEKQTMFGVVADWLNEHGNIENPETTGLIDEILRAMGF